MSKATFILLWLKIAFLTKQMPSLPFVSPKSVITHFACQYKTRDASVACLKIIFRFQKWVEQTSKD